MSVNIKLSFMVRFCYTRSDRIDKKQMQCRLSLLIRKVSIQSNIRIGKGLESETGIAYFAWILEVKQK